MPRVLTCAAAMISFCDNCDRSLKSYLLFGTFVGHHFGNFRDCPFGIRVDFPLDFLQFRNGFFQLKIKKSESGIYLVELKQFVLYDRLGEGSSEKKCCW